MLPFQRVFAIACGGVLVMAVGCAAFSSDGDLGGRTFHIFTTGSDNDKIESWIATDPSGELYANAVRDNGTPIAKLAAPIRFTAVPNKPSVYKLQNLWDIQAQKGGTYSPASARNKFCGRVEGLRINCQLAERYAFEIEFRPLPRRGNYPLDYKMYDTDRFADGYSGYISFTDKNPKYLQEGYYSKSSGMTVQLYETENPTETPTENPTETPTENPTEPPTENQEPSVCQNARDDLAIAAAELSLATAKRTKAQHEVQSTCLAAEMSLEERRGARLSSMMEENTHELITTLLFAAASGAVGGSGVIAAMSWLVPRRAVQQSRLLG